MKAMDIMVSPVFTVRPNTSVTQAAKLLLEHRISGLPVVDDRGAVVGILSEGDLLRRTEAGTERHRSWWLRLLTAEGAIATDYAKAHARTVADVMTGHVITAHPDAPIATIADLMEKNSIKRVPILRDGKLVGIVSRSNLVQLVAAAVPNLDLTLSDSDLRERLLAKLNAEPWFHTRRLNVTVHAGIVDLWGITFSEGERKAVRILAENIPGVRAVHDRLFVRGLDTLEI